MISVPPPAIPPLPCPHSAAIVFGIKLRPSQMVGKFSTVSPATPFEIILIQVLTKLFPIGLKFTVVHTSFEGFLLQAQPPKYLVVHSSTTRLC